MWNQFARAVRTANAQAWLAYPAKDLMALLSARNYMALAPFDFGSTVVMISPEGYTRMFVPGLN